jgi:hypothetical protein
MAGAGKKTFTAGEVLTASDVNTYLMEQSVMYFAGTAARSSAIPTPSTGMTTYIGVTGTASIPQIETYTGSAWQTPYGLTLVAKANFTGASTATLANVFSSAYDNYFIVIDDAVAATGGGDQFVCQFKNSTQTGTSNYANVVYAQYSSTVVTGAPFNNTTHMPIAQVINTSTATSGVMQIQSPFKAKTTGVQSTGSQHQTGGYYRTGTGYVNDTNSYTDISFFCLSATTFAMNVSVYGYRKS